MKYSTEDAVQVAKFLEPVFAKAGMHIAVGGSCIYAGGSNKDIDIFVYPHEAKPIDKEQVITMIKAMGYNSLRNTNFHPFNKEDYPIPDVLVTQHTITGKRVDFFILHRPDHQ